MGSSESHPCCMKREKKASKRLVYRIHCVKSTRTDTPSLTTSNSGKTSQVDDLAEMFIQKQ